MSKILLVIPMYNKEEYTNKCVELAIDNSGIYNEPMEVLVVDDGSIKPYINPKVNVLRLDVNTGFTNAVNQGILWGKDRFDYVLLLNNDTEPEMDYLKHLVDALEADPKVGIAASVRRHVNREPQCIELCGSDLIRGYQYFTEEEKLPENPVPCNWIPLCSGLLRMSMVREIGLLDKRFRNHCSDSSYCLWAKINQWGVVFVPKSIVLHHLSVTTTANNIMVDDDQKKFLEKLAGMDYAQIMAHVPLDGEAKTFGKIDFSVFTK